MGHAAPVAPAASDENTGAPPLSSARARAAIARARRMLEKKEQQEDYPGIATCYLRLGDAYLRSGEGELAEEAYRNSLCLARLLAS